jgi:hypothetical protein
MARGAVNKSQMIRDALAAQPRKTPTEIAELLKEQGLKVSGQYVSTIKSNWKKARRRRRTLTVRGTARRTRGPVDKKSLAGLSAALEFLRSVGGLENAKAALGALEEIGKAVK